MTTDRCPTCGNHRSIVANEHTEKAAICLDPWHAQADAPTKELSNGDWKRNDPVHTDNNIDCLDTCRNKTMTNPLNDASQPEPVERCQECGVENVVWFTDNIVWNRVIPGRTAMLCPICFIRRADGVIPNTGWKLVSENLQPAPSGSAREWREKHGTHGIDIGQWTDDDAEAYAAARIAELMRPLKEACDREWKDETPEQIVTITANAIYWRGRDHAAARQRIEELEGAIRDILQEFEDHDLGGECWIKARVALGAQREEK